MTRPDGEAGVPVFVRSRSGAMFGTVTRWDGDAITVLSSDGRGYHSAHRSRAAQVFGTHKLTRTADIHSVNLDGVPVVETRWEVAR